MQNPSTLIHSHNVLTFPDEAEVPNCLQEKRNYAHLGDRKCIYHFTPLAQCAVNDLFLIIDYL